VWELLGGLAGEDFNVRQEWLRAFQALKIDKKSKATKMLRSFIEREVTASDVLNIADWYRWNTGSNIYVLKLDLLIDAGFRSEKDLSLLSCEDLLILLSYGTIPPKEFLESNADGLEQFLAYSNVLWNFNFRDESPTGIEVVNLLSTGLHPSGLETLVREIYSPIISHKSDYGLDAHLRNVRGQGFYDTLTETVISLSETGLMVNAANILKYWALSEDMILHLIDRDLLDLDSLKIARLMDSTDELDTWVLIQPGVIAAGQVKKWRRYGFEANEAEQWSRAGFSAGSASKWRKNVNDPIVARRRIDAGIRLPK
jgi:hypothetical protein